MSIAPENEEEKGEEDSDEEQDPGIGVREPRRPILPRAGCALELEIPKNQENS